MPTARRQMHLGVFVLGTGNHMAGWRTDGAFTTHMELPVMHEIARIAEAGKFDLLFISDSMAMDPTDHPSFLCRFEPTTLITALAACTTHVGLGATVSTSFSEPYNVARIFGSIDHISGGRAGWNVVTMLRPCSTHTGSPLYCASTVLPGPKRRMIGARMNTASSVAPSGIGMFAMRLSIWRP